MCAYDVSRRQSHVEIQQVEMINRDRNDPWHWTIVRALVLALLAAGLSGAPIGGVAHAQQPPSEVGQWEIRSTTVFGLFEIVLPTGKV